MQLALIRLSKADLEINPERFHVLMCAENSAQMQKMIDTMAQVKRHKMYSAEMIVAANKLIAEIKESTDAIYPPATKDVPCPVPAGRPEDV